MTADTSADKLVDTLGDTLVDSFTLGGHFGEFLDFDGLTGGHIGGH
jgi:hypothetical protein